MSASAQASGSGTQGAAPPPEPAAQPVNPIAKLADAILLGLKESRSEGKIKATPPKPFTNDPKWTSSEKQTWWETAERYFWAASPPEPGQKELSAFLTYFGEGANEWAQDVDADLD